MKANASGTCFHHIRRKTDSESVSPGSNPGRPSKSTCAKTVSSNRDLYLLSATSHPNIWGYRLPGRTPASQAGEEGSNPSNPIFLYLTRLKLLIPGIHLVICLCRRKIDGLRWVGLSVEQSQEKKCPTCERVYGPDLEYCPFDGGMLAAPAVPGARPQQSGYSVGQTVADKYTILSTPKVGRLSAVYKARDVQANRVVAFKVLHAEHKNDRGINTRFQNEGYLLSSLTHPHIISIHDFGITKEGTQFMALKYIEGMSLLDLMKQDKKVEPRRMGVLFSQICDGLSAVHQLMKIHGAIYPHHLMLTPTGSADIVTIIDFSRSQSLGVKQEDPPELDYFGDATKGILYASPEHMTGDALDDRSDIYSLGCILYEALTGVAPFEGLNGVEIRQKHLAKKPLPPSTVTPGVRLPQYVDAVILKALEKSPDKRHQTIEKFSRDFRTAMAG